MTREKTGTFGKFYHLCISHLYLFKSLPPTPVLFTPKTCTPKCISFCGDRDLCCPLSSTQITICHTIILRGHYQGHKMKCSFHSQKIMEIKLQVDSQFCPLVLVQSDIDFHQSHIFPQEPYFLCCIEMTFSEVKSKRKTVFHSV